MKYIPQPGDIIKCSNTRTWFAYTGPSLSMMTKGDKFKVLIAYESDMTGNNYNVTVIPLSDEHNKDKGLRINLQYRADTREFSYYHKNTLYAVFLKDESFNNLIGNKMQVNKFSAGDFVYVVDTDYGIFLTHLNQEEDGGLYIYNPIKFQIDPVTGHKTIGSAVPYVVHATKDNEQRLRDIFGPTVPKIPLTGNQLADELLSRQKYIVARVSNDNHRAAVFGPVRLIKALGPEPLDTPGFYYIEERTDELWRYALPVDMNGAELKEEQV